MNKIGTKVKINAIEGRNLKFLTTYRQYIYVHYKMQA